MIKMTSFGEFSWRDELTNWTVLQSEVGVSRLVSPLSSLGSWWRHELPNNDATWWRLSSLVSSLLSRLVSLLALPLVSARGSSFVSRARLLRRANYDEFLARQKWRVSAKTKQNDGTTITTIMAKFEKWKLLTVARAPSRLVSPLSSEVAFYELSWCRRILCCRRGLAIGDRRSATFLKLSYDLHHFH